MRIGTSFGDACRYCGSEEIILEPASSSGRCAHCSHEAHTWAARESNTVDRYAALARFEASEMAAEARLARDAALAEQRRAVIAQKAVAARGAVAGWLRLPAIRARSQQA